MIERRNFINYLFNKPLICALQQKGEKCSPRQVSHLEFVSQYTTDIRHVPGNQNLVADAFSRISIINFEYFGIDYDEMACAQENDEMLRSLFGYDTGLQLKPMNLGTKVIYCDVSTGDKRPFFPKNFRSRIFQALHGLSHPEARAILDIIRKRFVWKHMNKDIKLWCKSCVQCQRSKANRLRNLPLMSMGSQKQDSRMLIWILWGHYLHQRILYMC
ncbi:hypothetical protein AVEN_121862-1 [Araneus ventricosus]|uniref:RNA-directed DNA polymerase n=1 Tax=Araneus ventricosus TaxID=182803 RepID=A0A4Y2HYL1_ARAVE|nr:hypothetical protein AVEN_121862-1 [Araneus ventricosus]